MLQNTDLYKSDALDIANIAISIFKHDNSNFCSNFPSNCHFLTI